MHYHIIAFVAGFLLDLLLGDPHAFPHPIRLIGNIISKGEKLFYNKQNKLHAGKYLVGWALGLTAALATGVLIGAYLVTPYLGILVETIMTYQILATKCLKDESMKVYHALDNDGLEAGRTAVSMIVGRDTDCLDEIGVTKAAVETIAENTSDGVIAPMLFLMLGGPILGFLYKAVNTMDSMVGYKNDKYLEFGRCAAKLDDVCNFVPSRVSAFLMIAASFLLGKTFDGKGAYRIFKRDRFNHASPNSAQTEAVCAGALSIQLAGNASYFGKIHEKPYIGDAIRAIELQDIKRANQLLYATAWICFILCLGILCVIQFSCF
ncbi:MAG: adenosylcobinamide-phosphate synthase CbiB [Eubacteriales bacterium]|nr:adenosylcobinamide-phosphate synthase CbiB [Eubacteriales bacterium]